MIAVFRLTELHSSVCGGNLQRYINRLKFEANANQKRNKDILIEKRKSMIKRANETLQRNPKSN